MKHSCAVVLETVALVQRRSGSARVEHSERAANLLQMLEQSLQDGSADSLPLIGRIDRHQSNPGEWTKVGRSAHSGKPAVNRGDEPAFGIERNEMVQLPAPLPRSAVRCGQKCLQSVVICCAHGTD